MNNQNNVGSVEMDQITPLDFWNINNDGGNYNAIIAGDSGVGKTLLMNETIKSIIHHGGRVFIFDSGRNYHKFCSVLNGQYIVVNNEFELNPFSFTHQNINPTTIEQLARIVSLITGENYKLDSFSQLQSSITSAIEKHGNKTNITAVYNELKLHNSSNNSLVIEDMLKKLEPFVANGKYAHYFNSINACDCLNLSNLSSLPSLVIFELEDLRDHHIKDVIQNSLLFIVQEIFENALDPKMHKLCVLEEFYDRYIGISSKVQSNFIEEIYRTARRSNSSIVSITQHLNDYFKNYLTERFYFQADWKIILKHNNNMLHNQIPLANTVKEKISNLTVKNIEDVKCSEVLIVRIDEVACFDFK